MWASGYPPLCVFMATRNPVNDNPLRLVDLVVYRIISRVLAPPQVITYYTPDSLTANAPRKNGGTGRHLEDDRLFYLGFGNFSGANFVKLREGTFLRVDFSWCPGGTKSRINLYGYNQKYLYINL